MPFWIISLVAVLAVAWTGILNALLLAAGLIAFYWAWFGLREARLVRHLQLTPIAMARDGLVLIKAQVIANNADMQAPASQTRCTYWTAQLDGLRGKDKGAKSRMPIQHLGQAYSDRGLVRLRDASGECLLAIDEAELFLPQTVHRISAADFISAQSYWKAIFPRIEAFDLRSFLRGFRIVESHIGIGCEVYVIGTMQRSTEHAPTPRPPEPFIRRDDRQGAGLTVSVYPPSQLHRKQLIKSLAGLAFGLLMLALSLLLLTGVLSL